MNTEEREQLSRFLQQLTQAQAIQKDGEAAALIHEACLRQPDAAYLLVQRAMLLDSAVADSQAQIARLQEALEQLQNQGRSATNGGGFIDANAWGNSPVRQSSPPARAAADPATAQASAASLAPSAWGSGMLGNIATTAAGVVAGGFLFQGIGHLLGNHGANAVSSGATNGLSSNPPAEPRELASSAQYADGNGGNAGVFDTSSVDDFIAGGGDDIV